MRGTRCGSLQSIVELQNVPRAHLATGLVQAVPLHRLGVQRGQQDVMYTRYYHIGSCPVVVSYYLL